MIRIEYGQESRIIFTFDPTKTRERVHVGHKQKEAFEKINDYLSSPPVLKAPRVGKSFRLYLATQE
jgi:hypothetical protein